jgi:hypothetical protein
MGSAVVECAIWDNPPMLAALSRVSHLQLTPGAAGPCTHPDDERRLAWLRNVSFEGNTNGTFVPCAEERF